MTMDLIASPQLLFSALVLGAGYALVGLGLNLVYGTMRLLNVGHGDLVMLGAYVAFWCFALTGLPPPLAAPLAAALGVLLAEALHRGLLHRLLGAGAERIEANSLLVFFGLSIIVQNLAALAFTASPRVLRTLDDVVHVAGVAMTESRIVILLVALAVCGGVLIGLRATVWGLAIKAVIDNGRAAAVVGVDVPRVRRLALWAGFAIAGLAGALLAMVEQIGPFMGFPYTIAAFVVIILGGLGRLGGGVVAGLLLGFVQVYGVALTAPTFSSMLLYGTFVAVLLLRPQGLARAARIRS